MNNKVTIDFFKKISIRGRYAFSMCSLERCIRENALESVVSQELLVKMWEFTSAENLNDWFFSINESRPECILENHPNALNNLKYITSSQALELKAMYLSMPKYVVEIIDNTFFIGISELYSSIEGDSVETLSYLKKNIELMNDYQIKLPDTNQFVIFLFSERKGWGRRFNRNEIVCN